MEFYNSKSYLNYVCAKILLPKLINNEDLDIEDLKHIKIILEDYLKGFDNNVW